MRISLLIFSLIAVACSSGNTGDGRESGRDKHEWSILQALESQNRDIDGLEFDFIERNDYLIVQIPNKSGAGAVYVLLNPKAPPFYKQLPVKQYDLAFHEFQAIQNQAKTISTVEIAVRSHVVN